MLQPFSVVLQACFKLISIRPRLCRCAGIPNQTVQGGHVSSISGSSNERRSLPSNKIRNRCA